MFITVVGGVVILLIGFFLIPAKKQKERTLNFSKKNKTMDEPLASVPDLPLNVMFNFNGHTFDAYEALGVPAGSSLEDIEKAMAASLQGVDAGSGEFFTEAFAAIKKSKKNQS